MPDQICKACGRFTRQEDLATEKDGRGNGYNVCKKCLIEYNVVWRPKHAPINPNIEGFIWWKSEERKNASELDPKK